MSGIKETGRDHAHDPPRDWPATDPEAVFTPLLTHEVTIDVPEQGEILVVRATSSISLQYLSEWRRVIVEAIHVAQENNDWPCVIAVDVGLDVYYPARTLTDLAIDDALLERLAKALGDHLRSIVEIPVQVRS